MKYIEIDKKTNDELNDLLKDLKKESYNLRFQQKNGQLEKTARIRVVKKDIAKIKTKIRNIELKK
jgi:large subunit ribosomal protein L29|tara:strand:- start:118 stop:312 length:195 start_codon:yes stop_codon:yes gene_type:complete